MELTHKLADWDGFFAAREAAGIPADFLDAADRDQGAQDRDPFEGMGEENEAIASRLG